MNLWINPYLSKKFNEQYTLVVACVVSGVSMLVASLFNESHLFILLIQLPVCIITYCASLFILRDPNIFQISNVIKSKLWKKK